MRAAKRPLAELVRPEELQQAEETVGGQRGVGGVLAGWSERGGLLAGWSERGGGGGAGSGWVVSGGGQER